MSEKQTRQTRWARLLVIGVILFNIPLVILLTLAYGFLPAEREWLNWLIFIHYNFTGVFVAGAVIGSETITHLIKREADYIKSARALATMQEAHETIKRDYARLLEKAGLEPPAHPPDDGGEYAG